MNLNDVKNAFPDAVLYGDGSTEIKGICMNSRTAADGVLFFCVPGLKRDGHEFAQDAVNKGAMGLVVERKLDIDIPQLLVKDAREYLSYISAMFYGNPAKELTLIGITGTKGKTTTTYLIRSILQKAGYKVGLIGTVCSMIGDEVIPSKFTTPEAPEFQALLRQMADSGVTHVVMEVSAHALALKRLEGVCFDVGAFTNLSQDHFDMFGDFDNYLAAKMLLFRPGVCKKAVYNADDMRVGPAMEKAQIPTQGFAIRKPMDIYARDATPVNNGYSFSIHFHRRYRFDVEIRLAGMFNVYNALTAAAVCDAIGVPMEAIKAGLESMESVPGRMERLNTGTVYSVILDYAHSPDALENVLNNLKADAKGRVIAVFGCGGDRDREKRPIMGEIGGRLADYSILTSDNPRSEDPFEILKAVEEGIKQTEGEYTVIENRREAIKAAMQMARKDDIVLLAGKGHETYQEIMGKKYPFDEKVVVSEILAELY